ncbi:MAG: fumarylacetoacetate hydrolase family protein [Pseudomonadota bacterium]
MKLTNAQHAEIAHRLHQAIKSGQGIEPPSETIDYVFEDAYRIRRKLVDLLIADGGVPKGHKVGFTSEAMQKMYGMTGPDFGILLEHMFVQAGSPVSIGSLSDTRAEPELAFELAEPLVGPGITLADALSASSRVMAAIEVIDSRVGAMRAAANDSLSDNAGAGYVVLGSVSLPPNEVDLAAVVLSMEVDGHAQSAPAGDVMGHPAEPLAWLANKLPELNGLGGTLQPGDIVITGAPVKSVAVQPGSTLHATFGPFGTIDIEFVS